MPPMSLEEQISCVRQKLECQSFDELLVRDQVRWLGLIVKKDKKCPSELLSQWTTLNELLLHASRCQDKSLLEGETLDEPLDASEQLCHYPNCERGKVLYRHVYLCPKSVCLLCQSMLHLVKFHAGACSDSNCRVPRCGEAKEYMQRKEQRLRRNELRLRRLRRNEQRLRQLYMPESRPAAAAAAAKVTDVSNASADYHVLQLAQLSVQEGNGDQSNRNDENKLLGDPFSVSSVLASVSRFNGLEHLLHMWKRNIVSLVL